MLPRLRRWLTDRWMQWRLRRCGLGRWLTTTEVRYYVDGPGSIRFAYRLALTRRSARARVRLAARVWGRISARLRKQP